MARRDHEEGRCERAVAPLERVLASDPEPTVRLDAHWWLAHCHDQLGSPRAALLHYQAVADALPATAAPAHPYAAFARQRVVELGRAADHPNGAVRSQLAVMPSLDEVERLTAQDDRLQELKATGVTVVIIPAGTPLTASRAVSGTSAPAGILFRSGWSVPVRDLVGELVPKAHQHGLLVYVAVTLRAMPWLHAQLGWQDWFYDPASGQLQPSRYLDLFNPGFQEYLGGLLGDLARSGVDGVLFRATAPSGPLEGFTPAAHARFQRSFGAPVDLEAIVAGWTLAERMKAEGEARSHPTETGAIQPAFWRWIGWKSREHLTLMDRLVRGIRHQGPHVRCLLEVHEEAVTDPLTALVRYGEDLVAARPIHFDGLVIGVRKAPQFDHRGVMRDLAQRVQSIGEAPQRIWLAVPAATNGSDPESRAALFPLAHRDDEPPAHLIVVSPTLALP